MASGKYGTLELRPTPAATNDSEDEKAEKKDSSSFMEVFQPSEENFWKAVREKYNSGKNGLTWFESLDEVRADKIVEKYDTYDAEENEGNDPIVLMMTTWYDQLETDENNPFGKDLHAFASYERQIAKIAKIIIKREYDKVEDVKESRYAKRIIKDNGVGKTLLHLAAEGFKERKLSNGAIARKRNFSDIAESLLERDPDLVYLTTHPGGRQLAIELALENFDDEISSILINATGQKSRIRLLFEYDEDRKKLPPFQFRHYIERNDMGKTVVAVLDSMINPDWPMLPADKKNTYEKEWHRIPDVPLRYHFFYRILDGDDLGKAPGHDGFNHYSTTCLHFICESTHNKTAIQHPIIRQLADSKWIAYGKQRIIMYASFYVMYLAFLSIALLGAVQSKDPTKYNTKFDKFRGFCEVWTLMATLCYIVIEFDQLEKERWRYIRDPFNWLDMIGLISTIIIVPLRFQHLKAQWYLATAAYIVNFLRAFKFFPVIQELGLYTKILYLLMIKEMRIFAAVYLVVLFGFTGGTYLALRATTAFNAKSGFTAVGVKGFADILLRGFRALAEGNPFADSYDSFNALVVIIILTTMMVIILFLVNILIAQLSTTYEAQKENAQLQFDIDKALFMTRLENSRFKFWNLRIKNFKEGEFVNDHERIKELLKGWDTLHPDAKKLEARKMFK